MEAQWLINTNTIAVDLQLKLTRDLRLKLTHPFARWVLPVLARATDPNDILGILQDLAPNRYLS